MPKKESRRHSRIPYAGPIRLAWDDRGQPQYCLTKCIDISAAGLRVESPVSVPLRTRVLLNADAIHVSGAACLKNVERRGSKYVLGLELNDKLRDQALAAIGSAAAALSLPDN